MKIGIDLGGSHIAIGIVTEEGKIIVKQEENINFIEEKKQDLKPLIRDKILSLINDILARLQVPIFTIKEIGIGIPGIVEESEIKECSKYRISNWNLKSEIEAYYKIPIKIENDSFCSAKAEKTYGNLQNEKSALFLCLGTGIGSSIIIGDTIKKEEYGHITLYENGIECHCGKKGCFESYASMKAFKNGIIEKLNLTPSTTSKELLFILKNQVDNVNIKEYIENYINDLLCGISKIIQIEKVETVCIGGSFTYFEDILYKKLLEKASSIKNLKNIKFTLAKLKNDSGIIGATLN